MGIGSTSEYERKRIEGGKWSKGLRTSRMRIKVDKLCVRKVREKRMIGRTLSEGKGKVRRKTTEVIQRKK